MREDKPHPVRLFPPKFKLPHHIMINRILGYDVTLKIVDIILVIYIRKRQKIKKLFKESRTVKPGYIVAEDENKEKKETVQSTTTKEIGVDTLEPETTTSDLDQTQTTESIEPVEPPEPDSKTGFEQVPEAVSDTQLLPPHEQTNIKPEVFEKEIDIDPEIEKVNTVIDVEKIGSEDNEDNSE